MGPGSYPTGVYPVGIAQWPWYKTGGSESLNLEEVIDINKRSPIEHLIRTKTNLFLRDNMGAEASYW